MSARPGQPSVMPLGLVRYWYHEAGHAIGEYDGSGNLIEETVWLGDIPVATLRPHSGGGVDTFYVHTDQLNTPRAVTRPSDNALMWTWYSDPFGTDAANENPAGAGTLVYNLRFAGQTFDGQAGLHAKGFRDCYDPAIGRYCQPDPTGLVGGSLSPYTYVKGNPLRFVDPRGLQEEDEEEEEEPIPAIISRIQIDNLVGQIRQYDPNFRYAVDAPPGFRYGRQDIDALRDILRQYQDQTSCRINYGSTPQGVPFTRHYGAETGPVRNIPGSVIDDILLYTKPAPGANNTSVYYDPINDLTVVTGQNGIVSARSGPPRAGDLK